MKKIAISLYILIFFIVGCFGKNLREESFKIKKGMNKQQVISIMGMANDRQFKENIEVWQYRKKNFLSNIDFVLVWFRNEKVIGLTNYQQKFSKRFKPIDWSGPTDKIIEHRIKTKD